MRLLKKSDVFAIIPDSVLFIATAVFVLNVNEDRRVTLHCLRKDQWVYFRHAKVIFAELAQSNHFLTSDYRSRAVQHPTFLILLQNSIHYSEIFNF